jgi:hypothetical protein
VAAGDPDPVEVIAFEWAFGGGVTASEQNSSHAWGCRKTRGPQNAFDAEARFRNRESAGNPLSRASTLPWIQFMMAVAILNNKSCNFSNGT